MDAQGQQKSITIILYLIGFSARQKVIEVSLCCKITMGECVKVPSLQLLAAYSCETQVHIALSQCVSMGITVHCRFLTFK